MPINDQTPEEKALEQRYIDGNRAAWLHLLRLALRHLNYKGTEVQAAKWASEREEAIMVLRRLCEQWGDNTWEPELHLADILSKHLENQLEERNDA